MELISKFNKIIHFYYILLILFSKYAQVISLRHEKETTITDSSVKIQTNLNANQIKYGQIKAVNFARDQWLQDFCNRSMVAINVVENKEMYATHNERKY